MNKEKITVDILKTAKNCTFDKCKIYGRVRIAGTGIKMIKTKIYQLEKEHPFFFWLGVVASVLGILNSM
jgi:hypothetical protein